MTNKQLNNLYMPFFQNTIGLEKLFDEFISKDEKGFYKENTFPPYNIEKLEDGEKYIITMAVAGFSESEIEITTSNRILKITGNKDKDINDNVLYLHKGIAFRDFMRTFTLGEHVEVTNAELRDGMLYVYLQNIIPEKERPKIIEIKTNKKLLKS